MAAYYICPFACPFLSSSSPLRFPTNQSHHLSLTFFLFDFVPFSRVASSLLRRVSLSLFSLPPPLSRLPLSLFPSRIEGGGDGGYEEERGGEAPGGGGGPGGGEGGGGAGAGCGCGGEGRGARVGGAKAGEARQGAGGSQPFRARRWRASVSGGSDLWWLLDCVVL